MKKERTPRALADEFKALLYPPLPGDEVGYSDLLTRFNELCRRSPLGTPDVARAQNEMANHLLVLVESRQDKSLIKTALRGLLQSGRLANHAACRFIRSGSLSLEQLAPMVGTMPERLRLHLFQELMHSPTQEEKPLLQWSRQQIEPLAQAPASEIMGFLEELSHSGDTLNQVLRATLLSGTFPGWLEEHLSTPLEGRDFSSMCRIVNALGHRPALRRLAAQMTTGKVHPSAQDIRLMADAGDQADPALAKAFQALLTSGDEQTALAGAEGLARIAWPKAGKAFALLHKMYPALRERLAIKAATLPHAALARFLKALPREQRIELHGRIFAVAARLDPDFLRDRIAAEVGLDRRLLKNLDAFVMEQKKLASAGVKRRAMPEIATGPPMENSGGLLGKLFNKKPPKLSDVLEMSHSPKDKDLPRSEFSGMLTSRSLSRINLFGSWFSKAQFVKTGFSAVDFTSCTFIDVDFTGCTFVNCKFNSAVLRSTVFASCEFKNCEFTDCAIEDCAFDQGRLERCFLSGTLIKSTDLSAMRLDSLSFNQCQFQECTAGSVRLSRSALSHSQFLGCVLAGVEFLRCSMSETVFLDVDLSSSAFSRCTIEQCSFFGSSSDSGAFEMARRNDLLSRAADLEAKPPQPPDVDAPALIAACVDLWSRRLEILRHHAPLLLNNQRRLEHSIRRMAGQECFWMVPYLLHTDIFDQKIGPTGAPPCRMRGYTPSYSAVALAHRHFKGFEPNAPTQSPLTIEGLYAMGSVGSVAQTRSSDVDYWVCYDGASATPAALKGLRKKLDAITEWAMETFELEAYFFLMSMDDVRQNAFGFSDKESSGSAQAILLKEEFYRTVLPVAGLHPAWWATPPGASAKAYRSWLQAAQTMPRSGASRFVDMGHLTPIPADEFFGAAMWQIVKALHSPYKSVMKLGLLEKYSSQPERLMLADQIKLNLVRRQRGVERIDPYVVLFRELRDYYREMKDSDTVRLLTEALLLKAKVGEFDFFFGFPMVAEEHSLLEFLFGPGKATEAKVKNLGTDWSFAKSLQIGNTVSTFMTATYKRIQDRLIKGGKATRARITPEDMTRLGRQIASNFARKKNKIMRVPFLGAGGNIELHFLAEKAHGKRPVWVAQGKSADRKKKSNTFEQLHKAHHPAQLLAWLTANQLFTPSSLVDAESSISPLSVEDIQNALAKLYQALPYDEIFELEPDAYLEDERVTRVVLLVNLAAQPDANKIVSVDVVYATTWGELFCLPMPAPDKSALKDVRLWLEQALPHDARVPSSVKAIYPKRSQCPRLKGI